MLNTNSRSFASHLLAPSPQGTGSKSFRLLAILLLLAAAVFGASAQTATPRSLVTHAVDTGVVAPLPQHHPNWAIAANRTAQVPDGETLSHVTLVLSRPAARQKALEQFLIDVQNPSSPSYHKWLTPAEVGERFGLSDSDLASISGWLATEGLHVDSIAPSRTLVHFSGTAANIGRAFQTSLSYYTVHSQQRLSIDSAPTIPQALASAIRAVRGLSTPPEHPLHSSSTVLLAGTSLPAASPAYTATPTTHYLTPADFATIYDVPPAYTGAGVTIGIVGWSRVSTTDLNNYRTMTGSSFPNPTEVIPTAYHGVDPGAACTTTSCNSTQLDNQGEATLDVIRTGATAPGASLLLVTSQATSPSNDGIGADTEYMVETSPVPVQIISISFGACEADAGSSGVAYWDNLFQSASAEGISVFVSSGDSAAAGCDSAFTTLPGSILANSPNYICSSQYATCVGGTQFADTASPSTYWSASNNATTRGSALSYIPEGGWNESSASSGIAGSGGGVSTVVATPTWQTGTGVPSARTGRYTPDIAFSASGHDGYLACLAAAGSNCTSTISIFSGTSAAAPGMAGIAALLDQKLGGSQGNLNPRLYALASNATTYASVFHDATPATSGVSSCSIDTPSICNNSIYYTAGGAVQEGFLLTTGYDQVTGLGSLNVANFLNAVPTTVAPTVSLTSASASVTTAQPLGITVTVSGISGTPTGSVTASSGSYTSSQATLSSGSASITIPAGSLRSGSASLTATYIPDTASATTYSTTSSNAVAVTVSRSTPTVAVTPSTSSLTTAQTLPVSIQVSAGAGTATASGTVTLTSGSYTSTATTLNANGAATVVVPAGALAAGTDSLTASYTPDTIGTTLYNAATSSAATVTVSKATPTVTVTPAYASIVPSQQLSVTVTVSAGAGTTTASGTVTLTSGSYSSAAATLSFGQAILTIPSGTLATGSDTLSVTYTPDTAGAALYNAASGTAPVAVAKVTPTIAIAASPLTITILQSISITVNVAGNAGNPTPTGTVTLSSGSYNSASATLSGGKATVSIPAGTFAVGSATLTASYMPDSTGSSSFNTDTATTTVTVTMAAATVSITAAPARITTLQSTTIAVNITGGLGNPTASGTVTLSSGSYLSSPATIFGGAASFTIPAGSLAAGTPTVTATYTPDSAAATTYKTSTGTTTVTVTRIAPTVTVAPSTTSLTTVQTLAVAVTVSGGTGTVTLSSGNFASAATTLVGGAANFIIPAGSLAAGTPAVTATYAPDSAASATYTASTGTVAVAVSKVTPTVTITPGASSIAIYQALAVTVAVSGGTGTPTATGTVTLTSGSYSSAAAALVSGAATITIPANSLTASSSTPLTVTYTPDTASAAVYNATAGSSSVNVTNVTSTSSTGGSSSSPAAVAKGTNSTTTLTFAPQYGFTGTLTLTASVTSIPSGADTLYLPTFSFTPASITFSGTGSVTSTMTIATTATTTSSMVAPPRPGSRWTAAGSAILACLVLFGIPARRRAWRRLAGLAALLVALGMGAAACGSNTNSSSSGSGRTTIAGTTAGSYAIAVYGNGAQIGTVYIAVQ